LVEMLCVLAILAVLSALLFPVFARAKERAKLTSCGERLHQLASAFVLYRSDHDDRSYVWASRDDGNNRFMAPYSMFEGMKSYLGDGSVLWCPEPNRAPESRILWNLYNNRFFYVGSASTPGIHLHIPPKPVPSTVVAFCQNHTGDESDPRPGYEGFVHVGTYPFVREDTSFGLARSEAIRLEYWDGYGWYDSPGGKRSYIYRFPGEPWPPTLDE
jgi:type II secretory pathway pseudopilin PulG